MSCPNFAIFITLKVNIILLMLKSMKRTRFSRWEVTDPSFTPQADISPFIPGFGYTQMRSVIDDLGYDTMVGLTSNICVVEEDPKIILVNDNRELCELDLESMTFNEGTFSPSRSRKSSHESYCRRYYQLSSNGRYLVAAYITCPPAFGFTKPRLGDEQPEFRSLNKTRIELRFAELSATAEQMRKIELEYSEPELPEDHWHQIDFSPDLSMLRAGRVIFDLQASDHPLMFGSNSLLSHLEYGGGSHVSFSPCNGYLITFRPVNTAAVNFGLFRICRITRKIEKLATNGLEGLEGYVNWAAFHPILPLLLLTCCARRASDGQNDLEATKVVEVDLREPELVPIVLLQKLVSIGSQSYWTYFS